MRKVIGIGETILDIIFRNDRPHAAVPGGSVFNGLVSLGRLGTEVLFISELGNDYVGNIIKRFMHDNHISTQYIDCFPDGKSPLSLAFLDEQQNANYLFYKDYPKQRLEIPFPPINEDDIFIFGSYYVLNPVIRKTVKEFIEYAKERKAILYYDPNFRTAHAHEAIHVMPSVLENLEYADIVRGSNEDFANLFHESDSDRIYKDRIQFYCDTFLATQGEKGADLRTRKISLHCDPNPIQPVSTIGAGDNFNAGIIYALLQLDIRKSDIPTLDEQQWKRIIQCGMDFSSQVCQSYDNYLSQEFASQYHL